MSASQKLRALEEAIVVDVGYHDYVAFDALPKLIAVLEAAEWISESGVLSFERYKALSESLSALEASL